MDIERPRDKVAIEDNPTDVSIFCNIALNNMDKKTYLFWK